MRVIEVMAVSMIAAGPAVGCAQPCFDDGLLQQECPGADANGGDATDTDPGESAEPTSGGGDEIGDGDGDGTAGDSADGTAGDDEGDDADGSTGPGLDSGADESSDGGDPGPWCVDADGDGFGDPAQCSDEPGPGRVNNDGDCNDTDPDTHPGAAEHERDPMACTTDSDGDGWGDPVPAPGAVAGSDCWPDRRQLNPSNVRPGSVDNGPLEDVAATIDELSATLSVVAPLDTPLYGWSVTGTALRDDGVVYVAEVQTDTLRRLDYGPVCIGTSDEGDSTALNVEIDLTSICGLSFDDQDHLWAIDADTDSLLKIDPDTGDLQLQIPLLDGSSPLALADCGLSWDCHGQRLLLAHASAGQLRQVDPVTGQTWEIATYDPDLGVAAVVYEPVERVALVSSGLQLNRVPLDGSPSAEVGTFNYDGATATDVGNLGPIPVCVQ